MTEPANLIFFQSDNHNQRLLGCYGHPLVKTPNLDRIAERGVRFENAYCSSPLCCPSRASIANGRFPHQTGMWDNNLCYDGRVPSWMHRVREKGHPAVSVGKLHYRGSEDDNGFSREIAPMHIFGGVGDLLTLLRWNNLEPPHKGHWEMMQASGAGTSKYQDYDREITRQAIKWLKEEAPQQSEPWVLYVSYVSSHPPFIVPQHLWDLYPLEEMPLPVAFRPGERPEHPAYQHLRKCLEIPDLTDEDLLRRMAAGYFGLITHLDEQIGQVMDFAGETGLMDSTRLLYTSDHGESYGHHGLFNKCQLLETAAAVPLLMCGADIPAGKTVCQIVSSVDLFPTIVEAMGEVLPPEDADLPGLSLFPSMQGREEARIGFAEFHATGTINGSFMIRQGDWKLIFHVGMPRELFNLALDPLELEDLGQTPQGQAKADELEAILRQKLDPEAVDGQAKADQKAAAERNGGTQAILQRKGFGPYSPPPGVTPEQNPFN